MQKKSEKSSNLEIDFPIQLLPKNVTILSTMANGMFSTVYKAVYKSKQSGNDEKSCEMPFVVKHIKSSNHPKRVLTEMCLLSNLRGRHHIIPVWSLISSNFSYLVLMPFFTHDSFSSFFRDLTRHEIANYMYALLDALAYIHQLNVTHRDIKPTNFLYDRRSRTFALIDFGLAEKESRAVLGIHRQHSKSKRKTPGNRKSVGENENFDEPQVPKSVDSHKPESRLADSSIIGPSPKRSVLSPPTNNPQYFMLGRVGAGLTASKPKNKLSASTIRRRLRFSDAFKSPKDTLKDITKAETLENKDSQKTSNNQFSFIQECHCEVSSAVCRVCQKAPEIQAQRSGTTGYRAPEVLLRSRSQTTAIDVWAAGVVLLIILTGRYPFFTSKIDLEAVCQIMAIFGRKKMAELASDVGLNLSLSSNCPYSQDPPIPLEDLCKQLRTGVPARRLFGGKTITRKRTLAESDCNASPVPANDNSIGEEFSHLVFDLLKKLLEIRPSYRATAENALKHEFFSKFGEKALASEMSVSI